MKGLKIALWIAAISCLTAIPFVFLPWSAVVGFSSWFGVETLPDTPIAIYFFKITFAVFGLIGIFFAILARNPFNYGPMLNLGGLGLILFGVLALSTGFFSAVPPIVYLGDGLSGLILGIAVLFFISRTEQT